MLTKPFDLCVVNMSVVNYSDIQNECQYLSMIPNVVFIFFFRIKTICLYFKCDMRPNRSCPAFFFGSICIQENKLMNDQFVYKFVGRVDLYV